MIDSTNRPRRSLLKGLAGAAMLSFAGRATATNPQTMGGHGALPTKVSPVAGHAAGGPLIRPLRLTPIEAVALAAVSW